MSSTLPKDWRTVVVYGLGISGLSARRFLEERGVCVIGVDRRPDFDLGGPVPSGWILGEDDPGLPEGVDAVIVSPGVPGSKALLTEARVAGLPVVPEIELAFRALDGTVVGITGSNGKSTSAAMTARILEEAGIAAELCGNIGEPLSSRVDGPEGRTFVVELSSFQLEEVSTFRAHAAALLNLSPDHLDRHGDFTSYRAAKARIFERQGSGDTAVFNADDASVVDVAKRVDGARQRFFSRARRIEDGCFLDGGDVIEIDPELGETVLFQAADLRVTGVHNLENAMASALLARSLSIDGASIRAGLAEFRGLPHRLEKVADRDGVVWYDDSKGTNVGATVKSLAGFDDTTVHLVLGGRSKGTDFSELREVVGAKAKRAYLVGESAPELERVLAGVIESVTVETLENAVCAAALGAREGEVVLLSPACASFDQFRSFEHRGLEFQRLVRELGAGDG